MELLKTPMNLFSKHKDFVCGGEYQFITTNENRCRAVIYYRQPTSDEIVSYALERASLEETDLRIDKTKSKEMQLYDLVKNKVFIPYAKKIILRWTGYVDSNGKKIDNVDILEKYYSHHLSEMCARAFLVNDKYKKKI